MIEVKTNTFDSYIEKLIKLYKTGDQDVRDATMVALEDLIFQLEYTG